VVTALTNQGFRVGKSRDENSNPVYYIADEDGVQYGASRAILEELQEKGQLNLAGIKKRIAEGKP